MWTQGGDEVCKSRMAVGGLRIERKAGASRIENRDLTTADRAVGYAEDEAPAAPPGASLCTLGVSGSSGCSIGCPGLHRVSPARFPTGSVPAPVPDDGA